jgi:hypothetical protein
MIGSSMRHSRCLGTMGRLRFSLLRRGLLFAAQRSGEHTNELLTSNPIGHYPLEHTTNPVLILTTRSAGVCALHMRCAGRPDRTGQDTIGVLSCPAKAPTDTHSSNRMLIPLQRCVGSDVASYPTLTKNTCADSHRRQSRSL